MGQTKRIGLLAGLAVSALLSACQAAGQASESPGGATSTPGPSAADLASASSGLCQAIGALPDAAAAERAFENDAHAALHALAAAPGLERSVSAGVLESMERVEADFSARPAAPALMADLGVLLAKADAALRAIGQEPPACD